MIKCFLLIGFLTSATTSFPQNNFQSIKIDSSALPTKDPWDVKLEKYVWGFTHPVSFKTKKPNLGFKHIESYITIGEDKDLSISPDGKYFAYSLQNPYYVGYGRDRDSLVIQATAMGAWRKAFADNATPGFFSFNSKQYIYQQNDSLCFLHTGGDQFRVVNRILSWQHSKGEWLAWLSKNKKLTIQSLISEKERQFDNVLSYQFDPKGQWLICRLDNGLRELLLYNLSNGKEFNFQSVDGFTIHNGGKTLLVQTIVKTNSKTRKELLYINLPDGTIHTIWETSESTLKLSNYTLDGSGKKVIFLLSDSYESFLWYWQIGMDKAVLKVDKQTKGMERDWIIKEARFTDDDRYILFFAQEQETVYPKSDSDEVKVDVWSHKDTILQSYNQFLVSHYQPKKYSAVIPTNGDRIIKIVKDYYERIKGFGFPKGDYALVAKTGKKVGPYETNFGGDRFWEKDYNADSTWLVSLKDGSRRLIKTTGQDGDIRFSPGGRYLLYYDGEKQCNYFSIDLKTGRLTNISSSAPPFQLARENYYLRTKEKSKSYVGIAGWLSDDSGVLVYDNYDIWQLDMSGKKTAINITNSYGRKNKTRFALLMNGEEGQYATEWKGICVVPSNAPLLLNAFDMKTKHSGIYKKTLGEKGNPELLWTGPYTMEKIPATTLNVQYLHSNGYNIFKAADADIWIVKRQSFSEAPNYFLTSDFKNFKPLTNIQSHRKYNWLSAELHSFKQLDGTGSQGILYKPENFDSSKKYPVLIVFYSRMTDMLFKFPNPDITWSTIAPAFSPILFLNNGYLIFSPDMYIAPLKYGPNAFNVIEGAAKYLKQLPFVDTNHIGGAAHSWSAKLGAYIFTHSPTFSAIAISEGLVYGNIINTALSSSEGDGSSDLEVIENGFTFGNFWTNKYTWLDQTTVLNVDKATSPLLLYCGKKSSKDYQNQTLQLFSALRRLEKKAWWLHYETGDHTLSGSDAKDFTIRYMQFLDHYLKDAPGPSWMIQGISARVKQIEVKNTLDPSGSCSNNCRICKKWNEQFRRNPAMFQKPMAEWALDKDLKAELDKETAAGRAKLANEGAKQQKEVLKILKAPGN